tara:strand:- start:562 stop:933 length:372 start_codon:yes stop_codon:yes gene_type:complete
MYYIKLITNQDETRTPLISNRALNNFFNLFLEKKNDDYIIPLFYINSEVEFYTQIKKKQDNRIYLNKEYLKYCFKGNILVYKKESDIISVECFTKNHDKFTFYNSLIESEGNNLIIKSIDQYN